MDSLEEEPQVRFLCRCFEGMASREGEREKVQSKAGGGLQADPTGSSLYHRASPFSKRVLPLCNPMLFLGAWLPPGVNFAHTSRQGGSSSAEDDSLILLTVVPGTNV